METVGNRQRNTSHTHANTPALEAVGSQVDEASALRKVLDELPDELDTVCDDNSVDLEYSERLGGYSPLLESVLSPPPPRG